MGQLWCGVLNLACRNWLIWFQSKHLNVNYCFSLTESNFYVSRLSVRLRGREENVEEWVKRRSVHEEGLNVCKEDGGGWVRRGHIQRGRRVAGEGGGAVTTSSGGEDRTRRKGLSEWTAREETLARGRGVEMCEREWVCVTEIEEARIQISVSGLGLYLQDSRERREEAAMESTMGTSVTQLYLLHSLKASEFRLPQLLTMRSQGFEGMWNEWLTFLKLKALGLGSPIYFEVLEHCYREMCCVLKKVVIEETFYRKVFLDVVCILRMCMLAVNQWKVEKKLKRHRILCLYWF